MPEETKGSCTEEFKVAGEEVMDKIKELLHEGSVRHIVIKDETGKIVTEIPLAAGVLGVLLLPVIATVTALIVVASNYTIVVTRDADPTPTPEGH